MTKEVLEVNGRLAFRGLDIGEFLYLDEVKAKRFYLGPIPALEAS